MTDRVQAAVGVYCSTVYVDCTMIMNVNQDWT